jgi:tRNA(Ile2) C34 agmatinyltransferase TiaS
VARSTRLAQPLLTLRSVVVSGHKGREVEVDVEPRCPECGRMLGYLLARPWSLQCSRCKARLDSPSE